MEEDDKFLLEKNKKRKVKTPAQVQALDKFYNGLTEKQASEWLCYRRFKDKKLMNGENHITKVGKQERTSGVIQKRASGDSYGSPKLGDKRNFNTREVESGRELSATELTYEPSGQLNGEYNHTDNASSGSGSSLRNMSNHHSDDPVDVEISRYQIPKFHLDVSYRPGRSGYLKLKGHFENSVIAVLKKQLGMHYREDGPPLSAYFDPPPPGAFDFESSMHEPVDETYFRGEAFPFAPIDVSEIHQQPTFGEGHKYENFNMDGRSFRTKPWYDVPYHAHKKLSQSSMAYNDAYHPQRNFSVQLPEGYTTNIHGSEGKNDYAMCPRQRIERVGPVSNYSHLQPRHENMRMEQELQFHKYNDVGARIFHGENMKQNSNLIMNRSAYNNSSDKGLPRQLAKDGKVYAERMIINENWDAAPFKNKAHAPKITRDEFQKQHVKGSAVVDYQPGSYYPIMMRS